MSAANRGTKRRKNDWYSTASWCGRQLQHLDLPGGHWLEPCAGEGAIIKAVNSIRTDIEWSFCEIRRECAPTLDRMCRKGELGGEPHRCGIIGDYLAQDFAGQTFDVIASNPPFSIAGDVIEHSMRIAPKAPIVMLLRTNYLESEARNEFLRAYAPDAYVLPNRPSFVRNKHGKRATDATSYAWLYWHGAKKRSSGKLIVLPTVPRAERIKSEEENYGHSRRTTA